MGALGQHFIGMLVFLRAVVEFLNTIACAGTQQG